MKSEQSSDSAHSPLDTLCINTIRFLAVDAVQKANRGHPGLPMGAAPMAYILWTLFLHHNPANLAWFDRDRFILSAGHGSMPWPRPTRPGLSGGRKRLPFLSGRFHREFAGL